MIKKKEREQGRENKGWYKLKKSEVTKIVSKTKKENKVKNKQRKAR